MDSWYNSPRMKALTQVIKTDHFFTEPRRLTKVTSEFLQAKTMTIISPIV